MTRRNFTKAIIVARFRQCGGRCELCGTVLKPGGFECDHTNPDGLTGEPTLENAQIICTKCHKAKTANDQTYIAEAKRRESKHIGVPWPKPSIKSRGFQKVEKPSREPRTALMRRTLYKDL